MDPGATPDDLCEAVATLEEIARTARRVLGGAHPFVLALEASMRLSREALHNREAEVVPLPVAERDALQRDCDALERRLEALHTGTA